MAQSLPDPTRPLGSEGPQTYINHETPWWDASHVYGGGIDQKDRLPRRTGTDGKLIIGEDGRLAFPEDPKLSPDHVPDWWRGLELMFTLFVLEHNAVCGALKRAYPGWTDEELYQRARLNISALIAKIHNAEWTPAMMGKARTILGLSGGSYIAASRALVARGLEPGRGRSRRGPGRIAPYALAARKSSTCVTNRDTSHPTPSSHSHKCGTRKLRNSAYRNSAKNNSDDSHLGRLDHA